MRLNRSSGVAAATAVVLAGAALAVLPPASAVPSPSDRLPAAASARADAAGQSLTAVTQAWDQDGTPAAVAPGRDLSLLLADLQLHLDDLSTSERRAALTYLARPTDGSAAEGSGGYPANATVENDCGAGEPGVGTPFCVSWVTNGASNGDRPSLTDSNGSHDGDGIPDYVEQTRTETANVWSRIVTQGGYRAPRGDGAKGPGVSNQFDVYIAQIGNDGLYGYCTPESPVGSSGYDYSGYCVVDNDYSETEFGTANTPLDNLRVTIAHEFFHAVQFAYDAAEDRWFMEGSAAWMEDEIYDDVDDNLQYLASSPLSHPSRPLDTSAADNGISVYGSWIWWRHLTESLPAEGGTGLPLVMRRLWDRTDGATSDSPDAYSMQALAAELSQQGTSLKTMLSSFGADNRHPATAYEEGESYPVARRKGAFTLAASSRSTGIRSVKLDHMSNATYSVVPGSGLGGSDWSLRVTVDGPGRSTKPAARLTTYPVAGDPVSQAVALNRKGIGTATVGFGASDVQRVELTITNAGNAYRCWQRLPYSCSGRPLNDGLTTTFKATAVPMTGLGSPASASPAG